MFYVYIIRCKDGTLYTGYTSNLERRVKEHKGGKSCKYTGSKGFYKLEVYFEFKTTNEARKVEKYIKKQNRSKKEKIILDKEGFMKEIGSRFR